MGGDGSEDNDYWVDEGNIIEDVKVDVSDSYMNVYTKSEFIGEGNKRKNTTKVT